ncbi:dihydroorotase [Halorarius litoreus]|uniref:dihydroorotase n=1 Tax=Halorarius litoreus TaxID=2962676 RepID=UPI0020CFA150|nr:amidohydrolase family protein [Halorarius litoreus]
MTLDTVIAGGTLVTPTGTLAADLAIADGTIAAVGTADELPTADRYVDATDRLVMPGFVDPHVHIDGLASIETATSGSRAAALGGVTTLLSFAWQLDRSLPDAVREGRAILADSLVDYGLHAGITREDPAVFDDLGPLCDDGVTSFKLFTVSSYGLDLSYGFVDELFEHLAAAGGVAIGHTEDPSVCAAHADRLKRDGKGDPTWYPHSRPDYAEAMAADSVARLAVEHGTQYYGLHTSSRAATAALASYPADLVRGETCTHYTVLDASAHDRLGALAQLAPPLRRPDDVAAMFEALADGTISVVSSDHTAYTRASKVGATWWETSNGANALQTSVPVFHDAAVTEHGFSYPSFVRLVSTNPARTFGLPQKGTLDPGTDADVVVFDPHETYTITADDNASEADYSIYEGREVTGRVKQTFVRGELVADEGTIVGEPGHGTFLARERPDWSA